MKEKIYNIVIKDIKDKESLVEDMRMGIGGNLPSRACLTLNNTKTQRRILTFKLTEEEAKNLEKDVRLEAIQQKIPFKIKPYVLDPDRDYGEEKKLGIQAFPSDAVASIHNIPSGEDVDVVVVDGHMDPNNPEFAIKKDGSGGTRINQPNWFDVLYPSGAPIEGFPAGTTYFYEPYVDVDNPPLTDGNNHGAHVGGIIAGNTQGWAPKSNIYNISPYDGQMFYFGIDDPAAPHNLYLNAIKVWHENKPINIKKGTKNPTITNHSYGNGLYGVDTRNIVDVTHRGVKYTAPRNYSGATATTTVSSGRVVSSTIINQGSNYTNEPVVSFYGGGKTKATAYVGNGTIYEITITDVGEGYNQDELVPITFSAPPTGGQRATGVASIRLVEGSGLYYITMTNRGSGYIVAPTITFPPPPNPGRTAKATCKIKSGVIRDIVVNASSSYEVLPNIVLGGGNPVVNASILLLQFEENHLGGDYSTIKNGDIFVDYAEETTLKIVKDINGVERHLVDTIKWTWFCGEGYKSVPNIGFNRGNQIIDGVITGDNVEARAVMGTGVNQGKIVGINITNQGSGYTSAPGVVFTNGGGFSKEQLENFGLISYTLPGVYSQGKRFLDIAGRDATTDADLTDMMNSGVVVVAAAGNNSTKIDVPGGVDYDNKLSLIIIGMEVNAPNGTDPIDYIDYYLYKDLYYHRGSSPGACPGVICVGSLSRSSTESKNIWSDTGPRVDVYSQGDMIASTTHTFVDGYPSTYDVRSINKPTKYCVTKLSGTSMASPQVCGIIASYATANRNINQSIASNFIKNNSKSIIVDTGGSYSDLTSLLGGPNRCAYYPNITYTLYNSTEPTPTTTPAATPAVKAYAVGGVKTTSGAYTIHTFKTSGTLQVFTTGPFTMEVLVVAGGGGGGNLRAAGGGGGGGFIYSASQTFNSNKTITVVVGAGGAVSSNGGDSVFDTIRALGGGGGGDGEGGNNSGNRGGSGGGAGFKGGCCAGAGTVGQGRIGGNNRWGNWIAGGGGGGIGGVGGAGTGSNKGVGGAGGIGKYSLISGVNTPYSGGGGGNGEHSPGAGSIGGGGAGNTNSNPGAAGVINRGGGGGGLARGGSGVVIVRYLT